MLEVAYLVTLAIIFGGMVSFQLLFAPMVFTQLSTTAARGFVRAFFPFYYLFFAMFSSLAMGLAFLRRDTTGSMALLACALGFIVSRQVLMPAANAAADSGQARRFRRIHNATVVVNTVQLALLFWLLYRLAPPI